MREIKFRGKCIDDCQYKGNWLYGCGFQDDFLDDEGNRMIYMNTENGPYRVDPETVGQCTDKMDKNKKLIWSGDKVDYNGETGTVKWCTEDAMFIIDFDTWQINFGQIYGYELEVIN
ncbi:hypothetical protein D3C73_1250540 [compost metagenome]